MAPNSTGTAPHRPPASQPLGAVPYRGCVPDDARDTAPEGPASALPPVGARVLAFAGIVVGGASGLVIGMGVVNVQCTGDCSTPAAIGGLVGALTGALGVAVVAVLALRAMGEWRTVQHGAGARRPFEMRAEDARGVSLLGRIRGDDQLGPPPPPTGELESPPPASATDEPER